MLVVSFNKDFQLNSSYPNVDIAPEQTAVPGYDLYCYLDHYFNFADETSLDQLVTYLTAPHRQLLSGVYSDIIISDVDENISFVQYLPSFDINLVRNKFVFNIPFIIKNNTLPVFHDNVVSLKL